MEKRLKFDTLKDDVKEMLLYYDDRIFLIKDLHSLNHSWQTVRTDFCIVWCCLSGTASVYLNGEYREIVTNDLVVCSPNCLLERGMVSADFSGFGIGFSQDYLIQLAYASGNAWKLKLVLKHNPIWSLPPEMMHNWEQYHHLLYEKLTGRKFYFQGKVIDALIRAMWYEFADIMRNFEQKAFVASYSSSENLFARFLDLLGSVYPRPRQVAWYAKQLHVSPKYLSAVCRKVAGETASDILQSYVLNDVKTLLRQSDKGIKEVAYELDFPDLSFFGRYVKKNLGVSPRQFREQLAMDRIDTQDTEAEEEEQPVS